MRIERGQHIAGLPATKVRDFLRRAGPVVDAHDAEHRLDLPGPEAAAFLERLVHEGYLWRLNDRPGEYEVTPYGTRLLSARVGTITRDQADALLHGVLDRAELINEDPSFTWRVKRLVVFGSYLNEKLNILGDVDIAIETERKPGLTADDDRAQTGKDAKGRSFSGLMQWILWPFNKVVLALKSGERGISIHGVQQEQEILDRVRTLTFNFDTHQMTEKEGPVE